MRICSWICNQKEYLMSSPLVRIQHVTHMLCFTVDRHTLTLHILASYHSHRCIDTCTSLELLHYRDEAENRGRQRPSQEFLTMPKKEDNSANHSRVIYGQINELKLSEVPS